MFVVDGGFWLEISVFIVVKFFGFEVVWLILFIMFIVLVFEKC